MNMRFGRAVLAVAVCSSAGTIRRTRIAPAAEAVVASSLLSAPAQHALPQMKMGALTLRSAARRRCMFFAQMAGLLAMPALLPAGGLLSG
jgi:hypothetical protein